MKSSIWELFKPENEAELIRKQDSFFFSSTSRWFEFIGWLFLLGGLEYVANQTEHWFIYTILGISYLFLYFYLQSFLYNYPFYRFLPEKWIKNNKLAYTFTIAVGGILLIAIYFLLESIVALFATR
jgi:hypothetical protein